MSSQSSREIRVGVVSLLALILLIGGFAFGSGWLGSTDVVSYSIEFTSSGGIQPGEPVTVHGVKRGRVLSVRNSTDGVVVDVVLDDTDDILSDATAEIVMLEITGGKRIELNPGSVQPMLPVGSTIRGEVAADISSLVGLFGRLSGRIEVVLARLDTLTAAASELVNDENFIVDLKRAAAGAAGTLEQTDTFLANNRRDLAEMIDNISSLTVMLSDEVEKKSPAIDSLLHSLQRLADDASTTMALADSTLLSVDDLANNVNVTVERVNSGEGIVGRMLYDDTLSRQLDSTLHEMRRLLYQLNNHGLNTNVRMGTRP